MLQQYFKMRTKLKLIFFSDTHIGFDHPVRPKNNKRHRGADFFKNFQIVINRAIEQKVDFLIHCGDVFEKPKIHPSIVDQTYIEFNRAASEGIKTLIVPGNHERSSLPTSIFLNHPNLFVFDRAKNLQFGYKNINLNFAGFPYIKENVRAKFRSIRQELESDISHEHLNFLLVHHAIDGVVAGVQNFEFRDRKDTLDIQDLPGKFDYIFSGHIHKHQVLNANDRPVIYTGATERTMYDQINETCGYILFEIDRAGTISWDFCPLPLRPMYQIRLEDRAFKMNKLKSYLKRSMQEMEPYSIVHISAERKETLFDLSRLASEGFFPQTMNIDITGFSHIHRARQLE